MKIGLFYGSTTCYTEIVAEKIQEILGVDSTTSDTTEDSLPLVTLHNIKDCSLDECLEYDFLIFGISTWDYGEIQEDWESIWADISTLDLTNKTVALYGMGDQIGYTDWFQDALGMLHDEVIVKGAKLIGYWPNEGYDFNASKGLTEDGTHFVGLALDEDNQYQLTDERLASWCEQILIEYAQD
ncbi:MAG: flavodoxin FldB [Colwellia sp.]